MKYYSLNKLAPDTSFKDAVIKGLAPDKGLYFPESITPLSKDFFNNIEYYSNEEIAYEAIKQFVGDEIPEKELKEIKIEIRDFHLKNISRNERCNVIHSSDNGIEAAHYLSLLNETINKNEE